MKLRSRNCFFSPHVLCKKQNKTEFYNYFIFLLLESNPAVSIAAVAGGTSVAFIVIIILGAVIVIIVKKQRNQQNDAEAQSKVVNRLRCL